MNIGWFSTGRDEAARQLLQTAQENIRAGDIKGKISFVFSNREPSESKETDLFFALVHSYKVPLICFSHTKFKLRLPHSAHNDEIRSSNNIASREKQNWRLQYDRELVKRIETFAPDLCVLAGYMLIAGEELCQKYHLINLHPAPPRGPIGSWQEVIWALIQNKAEEAGAMMHLVTPELDRGPALSYCLFSIKGEPFNQYWQRDDQDTLFKLIRQHELAREFPLIILTLQALTYGEISIKEGKVIDAQGKAIDGYDLSARIDQAIKARLG